MRVAYMDIEAEHMDVPHRRVLDLREQGLDDVPNDAIRSAIR